jgi:hypothetical protein
VDAFYRLGESRRHELELHYYQSNRDGERVLRQDYQIGNTVFPAGSGVRSSLDTWFVNLDYAYAFLQDDRVRLSGAVGVHTTGLRFKAESNNGLGAESQSVTAPLPVVGARVDVVLTERWRLKGSVDAFYLEYDKYRGALFDSSLALEWLAFKHLGFGLGMNAVRYRVEANDTGGLGGKWNGQIRYDFVGALLYGKLYF